MKRCLQKRWLKSSWPLSKHLEKSCCPGTVDAITYEQFIKHTSFWSFVEKVMLQGTIPTTTSDLAACYLWREETDGETGGRYDGSRCCNWYFRKPIWVTSCATFPPALLMLSPLSRNNRLTSHTLTTCMRMCKCAGVHVFECTRIVHVNVWHVHIHSHTTCMYM